MRIKLKWPVVFVLCLPPIAGASALLALGRGAELKNKLLGTYYVVRIIQQVYKRHAKLLYSSLSSAPYSRCYTRGVARTQRVIPRSCVRQVSRTVDLKVAHLMCRATLGVVFVAQCAGNVSYACPSLQVPRQRFSDRRTFIIHHRRGSILPSWSHSRVRQSARCVGYPCAQCDSASAVGLLLASSFCA